MDDLDAVIVGAGHNGLVAAAYLARAGLRVLACERRGAIGGATVTEELAPGFRVSSASYSLSLLRPDVFSDLDLERRGLELRPKDPQTFVPLPDGRQFCVWRDATRTRDELARIHGPDGEAYRRWSSFWGQAVRALRPVWDSTEPPPARAVERSLAARGLSDVWRLAVAGSAADTVEAFFASDEVRGAFATQGIIGTFASVRRPGTAWVMAYHALGGELNGMDGTWAYVRGGMGSVAAAIAAAATEAGAELRTDSSVVEILVDGDRASGVRLADGTTMRAPLVLSNADPFRTFLGLVPGGALPPEFLDRVRAWKIDGSVVKVNLALDALPEFSARPAHGSHLAGTVTIAPSIAWLERAFDEAAAGSPSSAPFLEVFVQSASEPGLAPEGKHVLSAFAQYAPRVARESWPAVRERAGAAVLATIAAYAPNVPDAVVASEVLGPPDLEDRFALTGGNIFHGEILPEQCFGERFGPRTPVRGLYLCGSGAHPGGGVTGAAGRNAARAVLADGYPRTGGKAEARRS